MRQRVLATEFFYIPMPSPRVRPSSHEMPPPRSIASPRKSTPRSNPSCVARSASAVSALAHQKTMIHKIYGQTGILTTDPLQFCLRIQTRNAPECKI